MQGLKPFYTSRGFKFFREGRRLASLEKALQGYKPSRVEPSNSRRPDFRF